jgi:hypothetical protein
MSGVTAAAAAAGYEGGSGAELGLPGGYGMTHAQPVSSYSSMQFQPGLYARSSHPGDGGFAAGTNVPGSGVVFGGDVINSASNTHGIAQHHALWGQQPLPPLPQQQHGFQEDGLVSMEQLQQYGLQPLQLSGAAPMDYATGSGVSQGMAAVPGFGMNEAGMHMAADQPGMGAGSGFGGAM